MARSLTRRSGWHIATVQQQMAVHHRSISLRSRFRDLRRSAYDVRPGVRTRARWCRRLGDIRRDCEYPYDYDCSGREGPVPRFCGYGVELGYHVSLLLLQHFGLEFCSDLNSLGPMIGGAFNDSKATWRWAFYINLCAAALAAPAWLLLIPSSSPRAGVKRLEKVKQLDFLGITLFAGGVASIILILGFGGTIWEYSSARMVGLYVALGLVWVAFICQQWLRIFTISPIFPIHFFANVELVIMFLQTAIAISDILVTIYMLPLFFQFVYGDSTLRSGVYVLAVTAAGIAAAGGGGAVFPKFPLYMVWFVVSASS